MVPILTDISAPAVINACFEYHRRHGDVIMISPSRFSGDELTLASISSFFIATCWLIAITVNQSTCHPDSRQCCAHIHLRRRPSWSIVSQWLRLIIALVKSNSVLGYTVVISIRSDEIICQAKIAPARRRSTLRDGELVIDVSFVTPALGDRVGSTPANPDFWYPVISDSGLFTIVNAFLRS